MPTLVGTELVAVIGVTQTGGSSAQTFYATTQNIASLGGGGGGNARSINSVSSNTTAGSAANTDYVYFVTGSVTITLPTAVGNTNRYTIKNFGTGVVTVNTTSSQTIDGSSSVILSTQYASNDFISNNSNWGIVA